MNLPDPTRCPVCHQPNQCAMEIAKATGQAPERCWCVDMVFTPETLAQIPAQAQGKACLCAQCASPSNQTTDSLFDFGPI